MEDLKKNASQAGIEIVLNGVHTAEEAARAIEGLPEDIDAVYRLSAPGLDNENYKLSQAAIKRGIPMVSVTPLDEDILLTSSTSIFEMGRQAARFADQIKLGAKPAELPVETAEVFLTINLKTAEKIGLNIPDAVLMNADKIIR
jgi:putative ABC transport system substrate-binding protein